MDDPLNLKNSEIERAFRELQEKFPPSMTVDQAADLLQISKATLYDWKHRGLLRGCCRKVGKRLYFFRDRLIDYIFNGVHYE